MTRKFKILIGAAALLAAGLVVQLAVYTNQEPVATTHASWTFHPATLREARDHAKTIVFAQVVAVGRGEDIITAQSGEPDGFDRIPTQRVTIEVITSYKGNAKAGERLTLFQTGGQLLPAAPAKGTQADTHIPQMILEGDPLYVAGEQYLLMLAPGPQGLLRTISPEGRYRHDKRTGQLTAMVPGPVANEMKDKRLNTLESILRATN
jgi:hypothetical protein